MWCYLDWYPACACQIHVSFSSTRWPAPVQPFISSSCSHPTLWNKTWIFIFLPECLWQPQAIDKSTIIRPVSDVIRHVKLWLQGSGKRGWDQVVLTQDSSEVVVIPFVSRNPTLRHAIYHKRCATINHCNDLIVDCGGRCVCCKTVCWFETCAVHLAVQQRRIAKFVVTPTDDTEPDNGELYNRTHPERES